MSAVRVHDLVSVTKVVLVGASEAAIHVLEKLPEDVLRNTIVIAGEAGHAESDCGWLASYRHRLDRLNMRNVVGRGTVRTQCPSQDATKLERWVKRRSAKEQCSSDDCEYDLVPNFDDFLPCVRLAAHEKFLSFLARRAKVKLIQDQLESMEFEHDGESPSMLTQGEDEHSEPVKRIRLRLSKGGSLLTEKVVLCDDGIVYGRDNVPAFVGRIDIATKALANSSKEDFELYYKEAWKYVKYSSTNLRIVHSEIKDKVICIVGGGMTSAHLAEEAVKAGSKLVLLICRNQIKSSNFGVKTGWMGSKYMRDFLKMKSVSQRLLKYREERGFGTITPRSKQTLDTLISCGKVKLFTESTISTAAWHGQWTVHIDNFECSSSQEGTSQHAFTADYIWLATGKSFNANSEKHLCSLQITNPANSIAGFPHLDEESLSWPGLPVYCMGAAAALTIGPTATLPNGLRTASEKIVRDILTPAPRKADLVEGANLTEYAQELMCDGNGPPPRMQEESPSLDKHLREISNFVGNRSKQTIENYAWSDCDFEIDIIIRVGEALSAKDVVVDIGEQSLEIWANTLENSYHLSIPKLYKPIQKQKSSFRIIEKKGKIVVNLLKNDNHIWAFLRA